MAKRPKQGLKGALQNQKKHESSVLEAEKKEQRLRESQMAQEKKNKGKAKKICPFEEDDAVLLVGEGNFSFTLSLLTSHPSLSPSTQILATSYDTREVCFLKYPDAEEIVGKIEAMGVQVLWEVDAGDLEANEVIRVRGKKGGFNRVVFNFPHAGTGEKSQVKNIALNQDLILRFLRSVSPFLSTGPSRNPLKKTAHNTSSNKGKGRGGRKGKGAINGEEDDGDDDDELEGVSDLDEDEVMAAEAGASGSSEVKNQKGTVLITLRDAVPYTLWDLPMLLKKPPALPPLTPLPPKKSTLPPTQPRYRLLRSFAFHSALYPLYTHRRTIGFKTGISAPSNEEIEERGGGRTWEAEVIDGSMVLAEEGEGGEGAEGVGGVVGVKELERRKRERREERKRELAIEKRRGNGWKDKRPEWKEPVGDMGYKERD